MATMQFDLVSPERRLVSAQASAVRIPGAEGDLTAMPGHVPVILTLRPGILSVEMDGGTQEFAVFGGFAEITGDAASVLAEEALPRSEVTVELVQAKIDAAQKANAEADPDVAEMIAKELADLVALHGHINV